MNEFEPYYPPKPKIERSNPKRHLSLTVFSIVSFALTFSLITKDYILIAILIGALLFHELGHFLVMKLFGYKGLSMLFIPFIGAMVSGKKKIYSQIESSLMVMAGPVPGIILGAILLNYGVGQNTDIPIQIGAILIFLNVTNLIPLDPLDGGQLFSTLFMKNAEFFQFIFVIVVSLSLIVTGIWFNSWVVTAFGVIIGFRIKSKHKIYLMRNELREESLTYKLNYEDLSDKTFQRIKRIVEKYTPILKEIEENSDVDKYNQIVARQVDKILHPPMKYDASIGYKLMMFIVWFGALFLAVYMFYNVDLNLLIHAFQNR